MRHPYRQFLFVLLSLADLALTCWLLDHSRGQVYEANPLARWWLVRYWATGLACFKAAVVLLVLVLMAVIAHFRPWAAGRILEVSCAILVLVVLHSTALCRTFLVPINAREALEIEQALDEINREIRAERSRMIAFRVFVGDLCNDLLAGRCTLGEAVGRLARTAQGRFPVTLSLSGARKTRNARSHINALAIPEVANIVNINSLSDD